jgi:hypothetical protein
LHLHQRAVVRELMKTRSVELQTYYTAMYHDLIAEGLKVTLVSGHLDPRIRDRGNGSGGKAGRPARQEDRLRSRPDEEARHAARRDVRLGRAEVPGSAGLLPAGQAGMAGAARKLVGDTGGKPIMVYRPIVLNGTWPCPSRSPDPAAYAALYRSIKDRFFTVSVCNLTRRASTSSARNRTPT